MIAEESTSWPMVSRPTAIGGLGFSLKWDMGWMHDILGYLGHDPIHRRYHHTEVTFRSMYAYTESYVLPLSHDEVVYGKRSLIGKMHGDDWQRRANLRLLFGHQYAQPGKKLLFMGDEFGQENEWSHEGELDWRWLDDPGRQGIVRWIRDLNRFYVDEPAMYEGDCVTGGFEWVDGSDVDNSVLSWLRHPTTGRKLGSNIADPKRSLVVVACNFTPLPRHEYGVGVPRGGMWQEVLNSDAAQYGGSGLGNLGGVVADASECHGRPFKLRVLLPPLAVVFLRSVPGVVRPLR
jgi:1,4-alpha-glucan branching enzyme